MQFLVVLKNGYTTYELVMMGRAGESVKRKIKVSMWNMEP
jgi:hypothetical protein